MVDIIVHILYSEIHKSSTNCNHVVYDIFSMDKLFTATGPTSFQGTGAENIVTAKLRTEDRFYYETILKNEQCAKFRIEVGAPKHSEDGEATSTRTLGQADFLMDLNLPYFGRPQWMWLELKNEKNEILLGRMHIQVYAKFLEEVMQPSSKASNSDHNSYKLLDSISEAATGEDENQTCDADRTYNDDSRETMETDGYTTAETSSILQQDSDLASTPSPFVPSPSYCTPYRSPIKSSKRTIPGAPKKPEFAPPIYSFLHFEQKIKQCATTSTPNPITPVQEYNNPYEIPTNGPYKATPSRFPLVPPNQKKAHLNVSIDSPFFGSSTKPNYNETNDSTHVVDDLEVSRQQIPDETLVDSSFGQLSPNQDISSINKIQDIFPSGVFSSADYDPWGSIVRRTTRKKRRSLNSMKK